MANDGRVAEVALLVSSDDYEYAYNPCLSRHVNTSTKIVEVNFEGHNLPDSRVVKKCIAKAKTLPSNRDVHVAFCESIPIPIKALLEILILRHQNIVSVAMSINGILPLQCTKNYERTFDQMRHCNMLKEVSIIFTCFPIGQDISDYIFRALNKVETLERVSFQGFRSPSVVPGSEFANLCSARTESQRRPLSMKIGAIDEDDMSTAAAQEWKFSQPMLDALLSKDSRLNEVTLAGFPFLRGNVNNTGILEGLQLNRTVKKLRIVNSTKHFTFSSVIKVLRAVEQNTACKSLEIQMKWGASWKPTTHGPQLVGSIHRAQYLEKLHLHLRSMDPGQFVWLLRGLASNETLTEMSLYLRSWTDSWASAIKAAIADEIRQIELALENNSSSLQKVTLRSMQNDHELTGIFSHTALFHMDLNARVGRNYLMKHHDDCISWLNAIISQKDEPRISFWLLQENPGAISAMNGQTTSLCRQKRKRMNARAKHLFAV